MTPDAAKIKRWREDPLFFVTDELKASPDPWQIEALRSFADPNKRRISLQACAGPGKTALLAWCGWNFLSCYAARGEHPNAAAVSITSDNLKDNLWKELSVWQGRSEFLKTAFVWTKERVFARDHSSTWFLSARSWSKSADEEAQGRTLSGLHARYILYLIDESGDIPPPILRSAEQGLTNCSWGKIMQAGNPTSQSGMLYLAAARQRHLWHIIRITGDPDDTQRSTRINVTWAREQIAQYGRENPWVMSYILGQFPPNSINALLGIEEVEAAMRRHLRPDAYNFVQKRLGIDAARFGDDPWVIFPRQGLAAFRPVTLRNPRTQEVAARIGLARARWGSEMEFFDDTGGYASGAIDACILAGMAPVPVNYAGKSLNPRYFNKRSEMWFEMCEWVKRGGALPNVPELVAELTIPTYWYERGMQRLEEKDQIKIRLKRSPNYADALANTFAYPDMPTNHAIPGMIQQPRLKSDYDPFATVPQQGMVSDYDPFNPREI